MRHSSMLPLLLLVIVAAGCSVAETGSAGAGASDAASSASPSSGASASIGDRRPLPSGFPVMPGAVAVTLPQDDPGLIALWESDRIGSAAYDFYALALPEAGYPVVGLYPGGEVALIRFSLPGGEVWQVLAHGVPEGGLEIEVRLDRP